MTPLIKKDGRLYEASPINAKMAQSRRSISWMKLALPIIALLFLILTLLWPVFHEQKDTFRLSDVMGHDDAIEAVAEMINARFTGIDSNGKPYDITADKAWQNPDELNYVHLSSSVSNLTLQDGTKGKLLAQSGLIDRPAGVIHFYQTNFIDEAGRSSKSDQIDVTLKKSAAAMEKTLHQKPTAEQLANQKFQAEAIGHVEVKTPTEKAISDRATYDVDTNQVHMIDNVKATRDRNYIKGSEVIINLDDGKGHIVGLPDPEENGKTRVQGVFYREPKQDDKK